MSNGLLQAHVPATAQHDELASFLTKNKADFCRALDDGTSLEGWVIVMGNEAGDLDSIASAIGYAYFASHPSPSATTHSATSSSYRYVPLYQTDKADLHLRPENVEAFKRSRIDPSSQILFLDDLKGQESKLSSKGVKYALVDANNLGPRFHDDTLVIQREDTIVGIIDHHEDLGLFMHANPRWIQVPTGSCASLVAEWFLPSMQQKEKIPTTLVDLLISAIILDSDNVKPAPKGKAVDTDIAAISHLAPMSSFAKAKSTANSNPIVSTSSQVDSDPRTMLASWHRLLVDKKYDLSPLQGRDLLRRDYKEYESESKHVRSGLSSVPMALKEWLSRPEIGDKWENILLEMEKWGKERDLDVVGVLTSYVQQKKDGSSKKRREQLYLVRQRENPPLPVAALYSIFAHLETDNTLALEELRIGNPVFKEGSNWEGKVFTYEQTVTQATRKQVAPALKKAIEQVEHS